LDFHRAPLQRASRSPVLIVKVPGWYGASSQPSCSVQTCRVDVGLEPVPVGRRVAGRLVGARRRQPASPADGDGVAPLGLPRQREERPDLGADPGAQVVRHVMTADQEEAHALQRGVDLGRDGRAGRPVPAEPGRQVYHGH
jgi:hypothetical protein